MFGKSKNKKTTVGSLRRGQLLTTAGCGAIVDMLSESVIIAGTDFWHFHDDEKVRLSEPNLQRFLGVNYFVMPPGGPELPFQKSYEIPAFRFPEWMFCPKCKRLARYQDICLDSKPICAACRTKLIPSRFVVACENGHLSDFPYNWWVHKGKNCDRPYLTINTLERSSGLDSIVIKCRCGLSNSMAGCFSKNALRGLKCLGHRPWLKDYDQCGHPIRTLQRGASNLFYPITASALSIPPWTKRVFVEISKNEKMYRGLLELKYYEPIINLARKEGVLERCNCSGEEFIENIKLYFKRSEEDTQYTWQILLEDEYRAFTSGVSDQEGEFKIEPVEPSEIMQDYVDSLVLATRLREVIALRGFRRIDPTYDIDDQTTFTRISKAFKDWLPGMELLGEGIFININGSKLNEWETMESVADRYSHLCRGEAQTNQKRTEVTPRYILLHTLSHLLIRQLVLECGYATASIKERIYASFLSAEKYKDMSGILIYTAANDSEGSLGGLVREGRPDRFDKIFRQMLEQASWCSADPVCIQSSGQGVKSNNLAACHSCTLLPETSCESFNCFLDRAALVGTIDNPALGFFNLLLRGD